MSNHAEEFHKRFDLRTKNAIQMSKHRIPNEKWMEFISEIATQITEMNYGAETYWFDTEQNQTTFTEEAQDFFNERYDGVETLLENTLDITNDKPEYYEKDFDWCNDSGFSDVFNNSICECTAPQVNDGMCICGKPLK